VNATIKYQGCVDIDHYTIWSGETRKNEEMQGARWKRRNGREVPSLSAYTSFTAVIK
jgi:hypothetical protein